MAIQKNADKLKFNLKKVFNEEQEKHLKDQIRSRWSNVDEKLELHFSDFCIHIRQVDDGMANPFSSKASEARKAKILRYRTEREKRLRSSQFPPTLKVVLLAQRTLGVVRPFALT